MTFFRLAGRVTTLLFAVAVVGCSYLRPYINYEPTPVPTTGPLPQTSATLASIDAARTNALNKADDITVTRRSLDLVMFGLVTAIGVHSIHGAHVNALKNLALGTGVTYSGQALFFPAQQEQFYTAAAKALACIRQPLQDYRTFLQPWEVAKDDTDTLTSPVLTPVGCKPDAETQADIELSHLAFASLKVSVERAVSLDASAAAKAEAAAQNVLDALRKQLASTEPSADAILSAAKSPAGLAPSSQPKAAAPKVAAAVPGAGPCSPASGPQIDDLRKRLLALADSYRKAEVRATQNVSAIEALDTKCTVGDAPALGLFAASLTDVTISKDQQSYVTLTGGREPYLPPQPVGVAPSGDVVVTLVPPRTVSIVATSQVVAGKTYTYQLSDGSVASKPITLKITTK